MRPVTDDDSSDRGQRRRYDPPAHRRERADRDGSRHLSVGGHNGGDGSSGRYPAWGWPRWLVLFGLLPVAALVALAVVNRTDGDGSGSPASSTTAPAAGDTRAGAATPSPSDPATTDGSLSSSIVPEGPYVRAERRIDGLVLSGAVPDEELAEQLAELGATEYGRHVSNDLVVDDQLPPADWLAHSLPIVELLETGLSEGAGLLTDGRIVITGQTPSTQHLERMRVELANATGLEVTVEDVGVTDRRPPVLNLASSDGKISVGGTVPMDALRTDLIAGAEATYGAGNVVDEIEVDQQVFTAGWMYDGAQVIGSMAVFSDYEITIDDTGAFSGFVSGGFNFEPDSATILPDYLPVLQLGARILAADPRVHLIIEGHTDDQGPDEANLALSQDRADAVAAFYEQAGVDPDRMTAVGRGEAEPIAPNATAEGRASNRRIEVIVTRAL
jgi:outer membrane protein OmpA-like peptidoglycan-associated protein